MMARGLLLAALAKGLHAGQDFQVASQTTQGLPVLRGCDQALLRVKVDIEKKVFFAGLDLCAGELLMFAPARAVRLCVLPVDGSAPKIIFGAGVDGAGATC